MRYRAEEFEQLDLASRSNVDRLVEACYHDTALFAKVMFPEIFSRPFSEAIHRPIFELLDDQTKQRVVILAPRGIGKTTITEFALPAKAILYRTKRFYVPISASATHTLTQSENLKTELLSNPMICKIFGSMKSDSFSKEQWIANNGDDALGLPGTLVLPRGGGQQVRGLLYRNRRPDLIVPDDMEDDEEVKNEERRAKKREWFFSSVVNSVDRGSKDWRIIVVGTLLHEDSLLANLAEDPEWTVVRLEICDDDGKSNWPEFLSDDDVKTIRDGYRERGMLDVFYREYRNIPVASGEDSFKSAYFKYYEESDKSKPVMQTVILADPGRKSSGTGSDTAIAAVGVNVDKGAIYIRDMVVGKFAPDVVYDKMFSMAKTFKARTVGIETQGLHEFVMYPFLTEMTRRGLRLEVVELKPRGRDKMDRIGALLPLYRTGRVYHNKVCCGALEGQLLSWPRSKRNDAMDIVSYAVQMLEYGNKYFSRATEHANPAPDEKLAPLGQRWRVMN